MKPAIFAPLFALLIVFSSCKGDGTTSESIDSDSTAIDSTLLMDTSNVIPIDTTLIDSAGYIDESEALTTQIEEVYGEQWEFCDCVVKNDSVNNAILETDDDAQIDKILLRMDVIDQHCKEMLTAPNTTPDERAKHERKVNNCLRGK